MPENQLRGYRCWEPACCRYSFSPLLPWASRPALILTVAYAPGGSSLPHRHDAHVFVYVLEGDVIMQVRGGPAMTLHPGDTFYESPTDVHSLSANASKSAPAKILVFMVKDKGAATTLPVTASDSK